MMKKVLAKYGRHFWIMSLSVTMYAIYDFIFDDGEFFSIVMLSALTLLFFYERNGKLGDEMA
jgi:hypothetical protein